MLLFPGFLLLVLPRVWSVQHIAAAKGRAIRGSGIRSIAGAYRVANCVLDAVGQQTCHGQPTPRSKPSDPAGGNERSPCANRLDARPYVQSGKWCPQDTEDHWVCCLTKCRASTFLVLWLCHSCHVPGFCSIHPPRYWVLG